MTREERVAVLNSNKQRELAKYATSIGIKRSHNMKKADLIETILEAECINECIKKESAVDKNKVDNQSVEVTIKEEKEVASTVDNQKMQYIENAEVGTIVAFTTNGKTKSAKIVKKSTKKRRFMLETSYGAQYIIPYNDVIWVRTGSKWPRGVYNLLKGINLEMDRSK